MAKKETSLMSKEEFDEGMTDIIAEYEEKIDIRIRADKEFVDGWNSKIKRVGNYKSKLIAYDKYPTVGNPASTIAAYSEIGAKNLADLIENRDKFVREGVYAYILSECFSERKSPISSALSKEYFKYGWPLYPIIGAIVGLFFKWWLAIGLGVAGLLAGFATLRYACDKEKCELYSKKISAYNRARKYVEAELCSLSEEEQKRISSNKIKLNNQKLKAEFEQRKIAALRAEIDALSRPGYSTKSADSQSSSGTESTNSGGGRSEVVDEYGRSQGYVEDGRLYNNKSDLVGYVDGNNQVYDKSSTRMGEVGNDGKITKYK